MKTFLRCCGLLALWAMLPGLYNSRADDPKPQAVPTAKRLCKVPCSGEGEPFLVVTPEGVRLATPYREIIGSKMIKNPPLAISGHTTTLKLTVDKVRLWDAATGKETNPAGAKIGYEASDWSQGRVSPDGSRFVHIVSADRAEARDAWPAKYRISVADTKTGKNLYKGDPIVAKRTSEYYAPDASFAADGTLVMFSEGVCNLFRPDETKPSRTFSILPKNIPTRQPLLYLPYLWGNGVLSPDGERLALAAQGTVRVFDTKTGNVLFETRFEPLPRHPADPPTAPAAFAPLKLAFPASLTEEKLLVYQMPTFTKMDEYQGSLRLFDLKEKKEILRTPIAYKRPHNFRNEQVFFTAKNEPCLLFVESILDPQKRITTYHCKLLDANTAKTLTLLTLEAQEHVSTFAISRDHKYLIRSFYEGPALKATPAAELWSLDLP